MGLSSFFNKLVSYGGISINDGILRVWKDPNVFFEKSVYTTFHLECYELLGSDFDEFIYDLGKMSGYNSSITLGQFFGIKKQNLWKMNHADADMYMNGGTQDGWGDIKITKYPESNEKPETELEIKDDFINFPLINKYKNIKKIKFHNYVTGIVAGGITYLGDRHFDVIEEKCSIDSANKACKLISKETKQLSESKLFLKNELSLHKLYEKTAPMYKSRIYEFKPFTIFKIKFGDGNFKIKNYDGSVMVIISLCIINHVLKKQLEHKDYNKILNNTTKAHVEIIKKELKDIKEYGLKSFKRILDEVSLFGYGKFEVTISGEKNNIIMITNRNNPVAKDYYTLFGKQTTVSDDYLSILFVNIMKIFFNKESTCEEINCLSKAESACIFRLILK